MMKDDYINVSVDGKMEQLHYQYDDGAADYFIFDKDIQIGEWTVKKVIKLGGPRSSSYKYDFKNYLEFLILDKNGVSRTKVWFYNDYYHPDSEIGEYSHECGPIYSVAYFCKEYPAFKSLDWNDYDASVKLKEIQKILERTDIDNSTKYERIKSYME